MIILASKSSIRSQLLRQAGVSHHIKTANIDETLLQNAQPTLTPAILATRLAQAKAAAVARQVPDNLVIGADQTLEYDGRSLHKAPDRFSARQVLQQLSGQTHRLHSAVTVMKADNVLFSFTGHAQLHMRTFTSQFLDSYLNDEGEDILQSVGCYKIEGRGLQLFDTIEGDYFTILGLPLLPLLAFLREISELRS